jgi:hypothetical protein
MSTMDHERDFKRNPFPRPNGQRCCIPAARTAAPGQHSSLVQVTPIDAGGGKLSPSTIAKCEQKCAGVRIREYGGCYFPCVSAPSQFRKNMNWTVLTTPYQAAAFAWQEFIALNWPAGPQEGKPNQREAPRLNPIAQVIAPGQ